MKTFDWFCRVVTMAVLTAGIKYAVHQQVPVVQAAPVAVPSCSWGGSAITPEQFNQLNALQEAANKKMADTYSASSKAQLDMYEKAQNEYFSHLEKLADRDYSIGVVRAPNGSKSAATYAVHAHNLGKVI